ncbi:hypothetical protein FGU65_05410 [Methanoculleus sp. FWC-SCC1]|uniref:Intracellular septation protein A n=1 Tax=Methanoculleus frigidifontis TaxID=2584085 RepID=A0ABT8M8T2_9EURY|nr:hypothetical protein [Methanoculleus sp. FWC-SCC1]MDN7024333.1 hypothetical protein [Methanoculleus sp. FWC-SCC1]
MNILKQLAAEFAPWISFCLLPGDTMEELGIALIAGLVSTVVLNFNGIRKRYLFPVTTLVFFVVMCIAVIGLQSVPVAGFLGILAYGTLAALSWGSLLAGRPFTMDYAGEDVSEEGRKMPEYLSINRILTGVWAITLTVGLGEMVFEYGSPTPPGLLQMFIPWASFVVGWPLRSGIPGTRWHGRRRLPVAASDEEGNHPGTAGVLSCRGALTRPPAHFPRCGWPGSGDGMGVMRIANFYGAGSEGSSRTGPTGF